MPSTAVAMTEDIAERLAVHLLRTDGQEDLCLATYRPSTGSERTTCLLRDVHLPQAGERSVHGNVSFTGDYVLRVATLAAKADEGVAIVHSHPRCSGWQQVSIPDADAESSYAYLVHTITGLPLLGMTLAGQDRAWSARTWRSTGQPIHGESVSVLGAQLNISWNPELRPPPVAEPSQVRTVSAWGEEQQADLARLRVLVVGGGSVGLDVAQRIAASGVERLGVMDFDRIETINRDRLIGASEHDAQRQRKKVDLAQELCLRAATAAAPVMEAYDMSICTPEGHAVALDHDVIFSCVDRPWPRAVLNGLAYSDLIPVIDGGIGIDPFDDGRGMRNATWRSHVLRPGRPCMICNKQLDASMIMLERQGLLDDPAYIARAGRDSGPARQNVATLSVSVSAALLAQFVSLVVAPGGLGEPGPLRYWLSTHYLEHLDIALRPHCPVELAVAAGDARLRLTGSHPFPAA